MGCVEKEKLEQAERCPHYLNASRPEMTDHNLLTLPKEDRATNATDLRAANTGNQQKLLCFHCVLELLTQKDPIRKQLYLESCFLDSYVTQGQGLCLHIETKQDITWFLKTIPRINEHHQTSQRQKEK